MTRVRIVTGLLAVLAPLVLTSCGSAADVVAPQATAGALALTEEGGVVVSARDLDPGTASVDEPVAVAVYVEPLCPHCKAFAADQGRLLDERLASGAITLEYRLVSFLDSGATDHASVRSVNAALCVAEQGGPAAYHAYVGGLLERQQPGGLDDDALVALADDSGAAGAGECIRRQEYAELVPELTSRSMETISGTPAVVVDGTLLDDTPTTSELDRLLDPEVV